MVKKVLIDGHYGAISLNIDSMLNGRDDLEVIALKDKSACSEEQRIALMNDADIVVLCQSAQTATLTVPLIENKATKIIDTSNAFRLAPTWAYGLPELSYEHRRRVMSSRLVAASAPLAVGASLILMPLVKAKIMPPYHPLMISSVVGYSSGGTKMIAMYEDPNRPTALSGARQYALDQTMMQQKELMHVCGISYRPALSPMIDDFPNGMLVTVPLHLRTLAKRLHSKQIWEYISRAYDREPLIEVADFDSAVTDLGGFLDANGMAGSNKLELFVFGDNDICLIAARYDNLGKGGASNVVQCMNLMLGADEFKGII